MLINRQGRFSTAVFATVAVCLCLGAAGFAQNGVVTGGVPGVAAKAVQRMQEVARKADEFASQGIELQSNGRSKEAMEAFQQAFEMMPSAPATRDRRMAYFMRYQSSAAAFAQTLIDGAKFKEAKAVLTEVYRSAAQGNDIPPTAISAEVASLMKKLKGDHFNPSLTPAHLKRVTQVDRLLIEARGAVELADFDLGEKRYNQVLAIDPYNTAARRGLEEVERYRLKYYQVARDHTRAKMMAEIGKGWETPVPVDLSVDRANFKYSDALVGSNQAVIENKLRTMMVPRVEFQEARLSDVLDFLNRKSQELDIAEKDPAKRGINFIINATPDAADRLVSIQLSNIPLGSALTYITQKVGLKYRVDEFAVTLIPFNSTADAPMASRNYRVPPGFLSSDGGAGGGPVNNDPFADPPAGAGGVGAPVARITAQEFLEQNGVNFEPGASASFNPRTSVLTVRNRPDQLSLVDLLVSSSRQSVQKIVKIDFRMISVSTRNLNELGFDWLLGQSNVGNGVRAFTSGGTQGNASVPRGAADFPLRSPNGTPIGQNPITAGLRSGSTRGRLTIDDIIAADNVATVGSGAAPSIFGISGVFTDPQFQTVVRAVSQTKATDKLCEASVVVRPGERASIRQVREFIYPTEYDPPELPNSVSTNATINQQQTLGITSFPVTPATPTAFETRELGKIIEVEPVVGPDNTTISLNISTDMTDFIGFINYGTPITSAAIGDTGDVFTIEITDNQILMPVFDAVKETTNVTVWDSQTIAIGGLITDDIVDVEDKVPGLGDLPIVGRAFRSTTKDTNRRGVIMFVSARILDPSGHPVNEEVGTNTLPDQ